MQNTCAHALLVLVQALAPHVVKINILLSILFLHTRSYFYSLHFFYPPVIASVPTAAAAQATKVPTGGGSLAFPLALTGKCVCVYVCICLGVLFDIPLPFPSFSLTLFQYSLFYILLFPHNQRASRPASQPTSQCVPESSGRSNSIQVVLLFTRNATTTRQKPQPPPPASSSSSMTPVARAREKTIKTV